jgi:hypothetical protein
MHILIATASDSVKTTSDKGLSPSKLLITSAVLLVPILFGVIFFPVCIVGAFFLQNHIAKRIPVHIMKSLRIIYIDMPYPLHPKPNYMYRAPLDVIMKKLLPESYIT